MKKIVLLTAVTFLSLNVFSQLKIGNNPTTINSNSILELESTTKGLLIPRVALQSTDNASPLSSFVAGMMIYNTATTGDVTPGFYVSNGSSWTKLDNQNSTNIYNSDGTLSGARTITMGNNPLYFQGAGELYKYTGSSSVAPSLNLGRTGGEAHFAVAASNGHGLTGSVPGDAVLSTSGNLVMGPAILSKSIKLITANNERLTILPSGNVGISNINPSEKLDVTGNIRFSGALMPNNTAGTSGQVLTSAGAGAVPTWTTLPTVTTYTGSTSITLNGTSFERAALTGDVTATANSNATTIANDAVTYAKMQNVSATNRLLGRATSGAGDVEEITLGTGLSLSGTTLSATGDLRLVNTASHISQDAGVGSNGTSAGSNESIMIGQGAGHSNSGQRNIFLGHEAGYSNTTPTEQIFIGYKAGRANTTGTKNVLIGSANGISLTTGSHNTAVGHNILLNNTTGSLNSAFGSAALSYNTSSNNTAIGGNAMVFNTGTGNTAVGALAMVNGNSSGSFNTALGSEAGYTITGNSNTLVGFRAGSNLTSGNRNILIGETIQAPSNTSSNQLSIGNLIFGTNVDGSGTTVSSGNIGIGVAAPSQKLEVAGAIRFSGALMPNNTAGTSGQVLTSAGAGAVPTWTTLTTPTTYTGSTSVTLNGTSFERAALTGDVTASVNSNALTIANDAVTSSKILDGTIATADVANSAVTYGKIQNVSANNTLLGRATSGAGDVEEITLGTGLSLSGTTLNAESATTLYNGDGSIPASTTRAVTFGSASNLNFDANTLFIDGDNNRLGIGTNTPEEKLHIGVSGSNALKIGNIGDANGAMFIGGGATTGVVNWLDFFNGTGVKSGNIFYDQTIGAFFLNNTTSNTIIAGGSGNLGVGNNSPSQKLDVTGNIKFSGALMPNNTAGTSGQVLTSAGAGNVPTWTTLPTATTYTGSTSVTLNGTSFERAALTGDVTASANSNALTIATDAVTSTKILDGTIATADLADASITAAKLNQMAATTGQILKWNGTAWAPAADDNTTADGSETIITAGSNITISGTGTSGSPYVINASSSIATVTADYTATAANNTILCNVPGAGLTLTLPSAAANSGKVIVIRKIDNDSDAVTFSPALNYSTTQTITSLNFLKTLTVQSNGTGWWIISE